MWCCKRQKMEEIDPNRRSCWKRRRCLWKLNRARRQRRAFVCPWRLCCSCRRCWATLVDEPPPSRSIEMRFAASLSHPSQFAELRFPPSLFSEYYQLSTTLLFLSQLPLPSALPLPVTTPPSFFFFFSFSFSFRVGHEYETPALGPCYSNGPN